MITNLVTSRKKFKSLFYSCFFVSKSSRKEDLRKETEILDI